MERTDNEFLKDLCVRDEVSKISPFDGGTICCRGGETLTDKKSSYWGVFS